ncbi:MAG: hypothetical protein ACRDNS_27820 [Trebonia sp.]
MPDEQERHAVLAELVDDLEQPVDLTCRQRGRRLVEYDDGGFRDEGTRDLDHLLLRCAEHTGQRAGVPTQP